MSGQAALCFEALGHPDRMRIVLELLKAPAVQAELAARLGISPASLSRHVHALEGAGLLVRPQGRRSPWQLSEPELVHAVLLSVHELVAAVTGREAAAAAAVAERMRRGAGRAQTAAR